MESSILTLLCLAIAFTPSFEQDTVVKTLLGRINGVKVTDPITGEKVYEFRGIRYGKPPTGKLRFKKSEPVDS